MVREVPGIRFISGTGRTVEPGVEKEVTLFFPGELINRKTRVPGLRFF